MRMRGVEKNISMERCQVSLSASLRCVESCSGKGGGRRKEAGVRQAVGVRYVSFSIRVLRHALVLQLLLARITNHSLQRLLVTSSLPLMTFGDAKLVN